MPLFFFDAVPGDFDVGEDGTVLLRPLGLIPVAGRPFAEVRDGLLRAYQRELVNAAVTITPLVRIAVLGEVQRPGFLPVDPTLSLADVVAAAGGITPLGRVIRSIGIGDYDPRNQRSRWGGIWSPQKTAARARGNRPQ